MVRHIILWNLKSEYDDTQKKDIMEKAKQGLEDLKGNIPGLVDIKVQITCLESSNADMMLDSTFENIDALKGYAVHPLHVKAADTLVRPFTAERKCIDFEF